MVVFLNKDSDQDSLKKRWNIQRYFWNIVGSVEHISLPMLEDAVKKEFNSDDDRFIQAQINKMQNESRIKIQNKVKVWIRQPETTDCDDTSLLL